MGKKVTLSYTADELGISLRSVRRLVSDGELRAYKVGGHLVRIDVDDIAAVLKPIVPTNGVRVHQNQRAGKAALDNKTRRTA